MRPILLKGHERPLTFIKYNREGDLLFTCAKDHHPTLWYGDNGERVGTYVGHNGAVWTCDVSDDSSTLVTGSADTTAKLWDAKTGECYFTFDVRPAGARGGAERGRDAVRDHDGSVHGSAERDTHRGCESRGSSGAARGGGEEDRGTARAGDARDVGTAEQDESSRGARTGSFEVGTSRRVMS